MKGGGEGIFNNNLIIMCFIVTKTQRGGGIFNYSLIIMYLIVTQTQREGGGSIFFKIPNGDSYLPLGTKKTQNGEG